MKLIATKAYTYAGRRLQPGDSFAAGARDARVLTAIGKARVAPAEPEPVVEPEPIDEPVAVRPKRQYIRRDMKAEA